jgi:hypothetical protein
MFILNAFSFWCAYYPARLSYHIKAACDILSFVLNIHYWGVNHVPWHVSRLVLVPLFRLHTMKLFKVACKLCYSTVNS